MALIALHAIVVYEIAARAYMDAWAKSHNYRSYLPKD